MASIKASRRAVAARSCYLLVVGCIPFSPEDVAIEVFADLASTCRAWNFLPTFRHGLLLTGALRAPASDAAVAALRRLSPGRGAAGR